MGYARPFGVAAGAPTARIGPADAEGNKLLGLELLRFCSALAVLFFHYNHFARMAGILPMARNAQPLHSELWLLYDYGQFGVQIFWGISGYIFFWKYGAAIRRSAVSAGKFFWLRFSRLYPLHLVTLVAVIGLQLVHRKLAGHDFVYPANEPDFLIRQLFLATDWARPVHQTFNGPIWSISAEIAVYAAFFTLVRKFGPSLRLCVAMVILGMALQLAGFQWAPVGCATYFFAGGLASFATPSARRPAIFVLLGLGLGLAAGVLGNRDQLPAILVLAVPCLLVAVASGWSLLNRWGRAVQFAGNLTYSSYLLHFPLQLLLAIAVASGGFAVPMTNPLFLGAYLGVTLGVAALSYRWFELPVQSWIRKRTIRRAA